MSKSQRVAPGIYKRGPYQFQVKIRRNGASPSRTFETLAAAQAWRAVQVGKITSHDYVDRSKERRTNLRDLLQRYMDEVTPTKKGHRQEANRLRAWMHSDLASYSIAGIDPSDISSWIAERNAAGKAPTTISNAVNLLSAVFGKAREWGYIIDNPCRGVSRPSPRAARFAVMSEDEQELLIQACERGPQWLPFVVKLALNTGMRQGEIRRLHWNHIYDTHAHLPETKNGTSRDVILTIAGAAVIEELRQKLPRRLDGWVFGDPDKLSADGGFTEWQVQQAYRDAAEWAEEHLGVKRLTFHDLRHVALTALAEFHDDVIELQRTSGHKNLGSLARYLDRSPQEAAKRVRKREARSVAARHRCLQRAVQARTTWPLRSRTEKRRSLTRCLRSQTMLEFRRLQMLFVRPTSRTIVSRGELFAEQAAAYSRASAIAAAFSVAAMLMFWVLGGLSEIAVLGLMALYAAHSLTIVVAGWRLGWRTGLIAILIVAVAGSLLFVGLQTSTSWIAAHWGSGGFLLKLVS